MKNQLMTLVILCGMAFAVLPLVAATETVGDNTWTYCIKVDNTAEIAGVSPSTGAVIIPSWLGGKPVTSIGTSAFLGCSELESVTIPDSVKSIGDSAFKNCTWLMSVTIPNSVKSIGRETFGGCYRLASITIPDSVTSIGDSAFAACKGLTIVTIGNGVTNIGDGAFQLCSELTSVTIPNSVSVKSIGNSTFYGCNSLASVTIPNSVKSIGNSAFYRCGGLTSVTIPASITNIGTSAFYECIGLTSVKIPDGVTRISENTFAGCNNLTSVIIPNSVNNIGTNAFEYCSNLTSVTIPDSVISIGSGAFFGCGGLTNLTIGCGVTSIEDYAFQYCSGLTNVTIPNSVTNVGFRAFSVCNVTKLTMNGDCPNVGEDAFDACVACLPRGNTTYAVENGKWQGMTVEYYGPAFTINDGILVAVDLHGETDVEIPDGVTAIGNDAFTGCSGLASVTIPDSVTSIGNNAFSGCSGLMSVTIPDNVTKIDDYAFYGCSGLSNLVFKCGMPVMESSVFDGCSSISCLRVEKSLPLPMFYDMGISRFEVPSPFVDYVRFKSGAEVVGIEEYEAIGIDCINSLFPLSVSSIRAENNLQINVSFGELMLPECETVLSVHLIGNGEETTTNFTVKSWIMDGAIISPVLKDFDFNAYNSFYVSVSNSLFVGTLDSGRQYIPEAAPIAVEIDWHYETDGSYEYATSNTGVIKIIYSNDVGHSTYVHKPYEIGQQSELGIGYGEYDSQTGRISYEYTTYLLPEGAPGVLYEPVPTLDLHVDEYGQYVDSHGNYISDAEWMMRMEQYYPVRYYHTWLGEDDEWYSFGVQSTLIVPPMIKTHQVYISTDEKLTYHDGGGYTYDPAYVIVDDGDSWANDFENSLQYQPPGYGTWESDLLAYLPYGSFYSSYQSYISVLSGYYIESISCGDAYIKYDRDGNITETSQRQYDSSWYPLPIFGPVTNDVMYLFESAPVTYDITFVDELGAENPNATTYTVEDCYDFQPPASVDGWDFLGWDVSGVCYQTGDITVTARWARSDRTVTFDIGAHGTRTGGGALTQTVAWGEAAESPIITADVGWVFTGWNADISQITESITVTAQYERAPLSIEAASGLDKGWTTGGNIPWYTEWSDEAHDGVNHLHSGAIDDNQESWIKTVVTNTGIVSFWWKVSSEAYRDVAYDKLVFTVDGVIPEAVPPIGGEVDWTNVMYAVEGAGPHVLRWTYRKDESDSDGEDCAWLDDVQYLREVHVTFADGGATGGNVPDALVVGEGAEITIPNQASLVWPKHRFAGWRIYDETLAPGTVYRLGYDDVTFTAAWEEKRVSVPSIEVAAWYDTERTSVRMSCDTVGAAIHYTLDGSTPTTESPIYSGTFNIAGTATIRAVAVLDDWFDSDVVSAESVRAPWTPDECLNATGMVFQMGGTAEWKRDRTVTHDGDTAMRSGEIGDGQTSWIETTVVGAGTLTFWWKASSEAYKGTIYDCARFTVDGIAVIPDIGGEIDWRYETVTITGGGTHAIRWAYIKDAQDSKGSDCAWLDSVAWVADDPLPTLDAQATDGDVAAVVTGLSDARMSEKVIGTAAYAAFRTWVDGNALSHTAVRDAPNAWLSYALDAPGLMAKAIPLAGEDIMIESLESSSGSGGTFDLVVGIDGVEIGTGARLAEALGIVGTAALDGSPFTSDGLTVSLERTADGKAKATVTPDGMPSSFFLRVKVK